ncbi:MAG: DNA polymerase I [Bacteroidales bacterium]|jgi:DNA polymerase-1|nr:DNA polymerase I [Bacteroidales bacterium]
MREKLFLLDSMALIFRAYYAMIKSPRFTTSGLNTSAIYGFVNTLLEVLSKEKPTHIAAAFDLGAPTVRHADYEQYKAHREATPDEIVNSIPYIKQLLAGFEVPVLEMPGYEADDIVGTVAKQAETEGFDVYMMTSDKDYGQLVSDHIFIYKPGKMGQPAEILGKKEICNKYGIQQPEQLIDILGLWGDVADNIPGVPGIGEVRARKLIEQFGSIENIYENINNVSNEKQRVALVENQEQALMSKSLATIILNVPIEIDFAKMKCREPNETLLQHLFQQLQFRSFSHKLFGNTYQETSATTSVVPTPDLFTGMPAPLPASPLLSTNAPATKSIFDEIKDKVKELKTIADIRQILSVGILPVYADWFGSSSDFEGFAFAKQGDELLYYHLYNPAYRVEYADLFSDCFRDKKDVVSYECKPFYKELKRLGTKIMPCFFDLQIAHYLIQQESKHDLQRLSEHYLQTSLCPNFVSPSPYFRACERVHAYRKLYPIFCQALERDHLTQLFREIEMPLVPVLAAMETDGVKIDALALKKSGEVLSSEIHEIEEKIYQLAGSRFNIASPRQLGEVLFEQLRIIDNAKLTKTKQYQTGEEILNKLTNKHPIVPLILEWRALSKLKNTYVDALPQLVNPLTGKIHTTFMQSVTSTGRLSSINPNLQNIPIRTERGRTIRAAFVPSDGESVLLSADYSQIELRVVASVCGDDQMIDAFTRGDDIHASMAAHIYQVAPEDVDSVMRRTAKTVNFGILYGISAFGLADRLQISRQEAKDLIADYFKSFPKINEYLESTLDFAREHGYVETLLGRRRYIRDINASNSILRKAAERNAINAPIQGTAADLIKIAMIRVQEALLQHEYKTRMILQVHDELLFDVPKDELQRVKILVRDLMSRAMDLAVPLLVEINEGNNWLEAH